jgi:hypothetical protein
MKQAINKEGVYAIACKTIDTKKGQVVELMQRYGMNVSSNDSNAKIEAAFQSLVPRSRAFRNDFSVLATDVAKNMTAEEACMSGEFYNLDGRGITTTSAGNLNPTGGVTVRGVSGSTTPKSFNQTTVGQILSNDSIKNLINTGLGVWAYKKTGGTMGTQDTLLNSATVGGGTTAAAPVGGGSIQQPTPTKDGMGVGTIVVIALTGVALVGAVIYFTTKGGNK